MSELCKEHAWLNDKCRDCGMLFRDALLLKISGCEDKLDDVRCVLEEIEHLCKEALHTSLQDPKATEHPSTINIKKILEVISGEAPDV